MPALFRWLRIAYLSFSACELSLAQAPVAVLHSSWNPPGHNPVLAVTNDGDILVWGDDGFIRRFDDSGTELSQFAHVGGSLVRGLATDAQDRILVTDLDLDQVVVYSPSGVLLDTWGGPGSGDGQFLNPYGLAVAGDGTVYVADSENDRIQRLDSDGTFLLSWGIEGTGPGEFLFPTDTAVDQDGNVYVADRTNPVVQKFTSEGTFLMNLVGSDFFDGMFASPVGVTLDMFGSVYISDSSAGMIHRFSGSGTFLSKWAVEAPLGIAVDSAGDVYVGGGGIPDTVGIRKFVQPYHLGGCPIGDADGDCDADLDDLALIFAEFTGPQLRTIKVEAGTLASGTAGPTSYFSNGNDLSGLVWATGTKPATFAVTWSVMSHPIGSGAVTVFDPNQLSSAYVVAAPAVAGDYVFELEAVDDDTGGVGSDTVTLVLD